MPSESKWWAAVLQTPIPTNIPITTTQHTCYAIAFGKIALVDGFRLVGMDEVAYGDVPIPGIHDGMKPGDCREIKLEPPSVEDAMRLAIDATKFFSDGYSHAVCQACRALLESKGNGAALPPLQSSPPFADAFEAECRALWIQCASLTSSYQVAWGDDAIRNANFTIAAFRKQFGGGK